MFDRRLALTVVLVGLAPACASAPTPTVSLPTIVAGSASPAAVPAPMPNAHADVPLPVVMECDMLEPAGADPRCPEQIVSAAILSHLDKTTAEFDGVEVVEVEHDPELLWEEASADAEFRGLLLAADAAPADGVIDHAEALALEAEVLARWERRHAR